jgi:Haem-binding uptake, Tiki superfamily, ChaN
VCFSPLSIFFPNQSSSFLDRIAASRQGGAVWLGEHHNSASDHVLQATMLQSIWTRRRRSSSSRPPLALGLEQIQIQFQPVLDDYGAGQLTESELRRLVEWDKRWTWPFEVYEPIFRLAKNLGVSLIALNVNSEDLEYVERLGLPGLPPDRMRQYIGDPYVLLLLLSSSSLFFYRPVVCTNSVLLLLLVLPTRDNIGRALPPLPGPISSVRTWIT